MSLDETAQNAIKTIAECDNKINQYYDEMKKRTGQLKLAEQNLAYNFMVFDHRIKERKWGEAITAIGVMQTCIQRIQEAEFNIRAVQSFKPQNKESNDDSSNRSENG